MHEILFRGKRKDNGKWVEGLLWEKKYNTNMLFISCFPDKDDNEEVFAIYPETVGQYTGLTDKNCKRIFEGDIIKWGLKPCVVKWDEYNASFCLYVYGTIKISGFNRDTMKLKEVIGNIYDNIELLKGAKR